MIRGRLGLETLLDRKILEEEESMSPHTWKQIPFAILGASPTSYVISQGNALSVLI